MNRRFSRWARGAAMTETVLVLPVVLVVLALLLLLGRSMMRLEGVSVMDRYEAWRRVAEAAGPAAGGDNHWQLNGTFLRGEAETIEAEIDGYFPELPRQWLQEAVNGRSAEAGWLVERALEGLPRGRRVRFKTTFASDMALERRLRLAGPMRHGHVRLGNAWVFANGWRYDHEAGLWAPRGRSGVSILPALRERYLDDLDGRLPRDNDVAAAIRGLYAHEPGYGGPYLDLAAVGR